MVQLTQPNTEKIKKIKEYLQGKKIDFLFLITKKNAIDMNLFYFTQLHNLNIEDAILIITRYPKQGPTLYIPGFEFNRIKKATKLWTKKLNKKFFVNFKNELKKKRKRLKTIGINKDVISLNYYKKLRKEFKKCKFVDISEFCSQIRREKSSVEIKNIKKACLIADKIFSKLIENLKNKKTRQKLKTETDIRDFLLSQMKKACVEPSFDPVVASGANAATPHYMPKNLPVKKGFCVIDFGVKYNGYCSDITRAIYFGKPTEKKIELYNYLLKTQVNAIKKIVELKKIKKEKASYAKVDEFVRNQLKKYKKIKNLDKKFIHPLGHGIGVEIHEYPSLSCNLKGKKGFKIKNNEIVTIEPGVYFKNKFGIRIEDDVLITKKGTEILTKSSKSLIIIK